MRTENRITTTVLNTLIELKEHYPECNNPHIALLFRVCCNPIFLNLKLRPFEIFNSSLKTRCLILFF